MHLYCPLVAGLWVISFANRWKGEQMKNAVKRIETIAAIIVIGALSAVGSVALTSAKTPQDLQLVYHATFGNGSLDSGVDPLGIGSLKEGDSQIPNSNPTWTAEKGTITLGVTRPTGTITGPVSAGIFATPVSFDQGSVFGLRATFVAPVGPHGLGNVWAVGVGARTGDEDDLFAETRTVATFQVRANGARLNAVGASSPANHPNVPQDVYDAIFDPVDPQPFTLELLIDRQSGAGEVRLKVADWETAYDFQPAAFLANSGPSITAVGVSLAIANAPGESASVRARDFQIFSTRPPRAH